MSWYLALVIVVVTLVPFELRWPHGVRLVGFTTLSDLVANVALFVPLGFFVSFAGRGRPFLAGLALSFAVELVQQLLPGRSPSLLDVLTNGAGAWLGGLAHRTIAARFGRRERDVGVAALDLPLMGLVYLAIPLLWLSGLAADGDPGRRPIVALLALFIAIVLSAVSRHHLAPRGFPPVWTALLGGGATALGLLPGWYAEPAFLALGAGSVLLGSLGLGDLIARTEPAGRRFEIPTVRRAMIPFACYLVLTALWPIGQLGGGWHGGLGVSPPVHGLGQVGIIRLLELMAAATVIGYGVAEVRGRAGGAQGNAGPGLAAASVLVAVLVIGLRGFHAGHGASAAEAALLAMATAVGVVLYRRQRAYVLALLGTVEPAERSPVPGYSRIGPVPLGDGAP